MTSRINGIFQLHSFTWGMGPYDQLLSKGFEKPQTKWAYQTPRKVADHTYGPIFTDWAQTGSFVWGSFFNQAVNRARKSGHLFYDAFWINLFAWLSFCVSLYLLYFLEDHCSTVLLEKTGPWHGDQSVVIEHSGPDDVTLSFIQLKMSNRNLFQCVEQGSSGWKLHLFMEKKRLMCFMRTLFWIYS